MLTDFHHLDLFPIPAGEILLNFLVALCCGFAISWLYRKTYHGPGYSTSFVNSMVLLTMITAMVMPVATSIVSKSSDRTMPAVTRIATVEASANPTKAVDAAARHEVRYHVGNLFSADLFYTPDTAMFETMAKYNVFGIEMEAAGIFPIAAEHDAEALAICTVSDDIPSGAALTSDERATTFDEMILVALETVIA